MSATGCIRNFIFLGYCAVLFQGNYVTWAATRTVPIRHLFGCDSWSPTYVKEISFYTYGSSCLTRINGKCHCSVKRLNESNLVIPGLSSITLNSDEYFSKVEYYFWSILSGLINATFLRFTTNKGRVFGPERLVSFESSGLKITTLENIRVLAIGGTTSPDRPLNLDIVYIENYQPSTIEASNAGFIVSYSPPFGEFEEFVNTRNKRLDSFEKITEHMSSQSYTASIEGEFFVKVSLSTSIDFKDTTTKTVKSEIQKEQEIGVKRKQTIPEGYVGVKVVNGNLMKGVDGTFWMYPTAEISYSVINITETGGLLGLYDLTGVLFTQMQRLKPYKTIQNGYVYYRDSNKTERSILN